MWLFKHYARAGVDGVAKSQSDGPLQPAIRRT